MQNKKLITAWCLYDWAIASFSVVVTTFVFATYFTSSVAVNTIEGTFQWANAASLSGLIIALTSPVFGAMADYGGQHKRWLILFTVICAVATGLLWFAYPHPASVYWMLGLVVIGTVSFECASVFYNAYLGSIVPDRYLGRISGIGWGFGYFGGIVALAILLLIFSTYTNVRIAGPFVMVWILVFALPFIYLAPKISERSSSLRESIRHGLRELGQTLKKLPHEKNILLYLIAHMIYTDGLNTLFAFGGIYAAGTYGLSFKEVMLFGITMNATAGIGAFSLGWMDDRLGSKTCVLVSLACLVLFGIPILLLHDKYVFWAVALMLCVFVGPVQAASRSLLVRIIDKKLSAEMFGLYSVSGKVTAFVGPWVLGWVTLLFDSQRAGMATVLLFFVVGGLLLLRVTC